MHLLLILTSTTKYSILEIEFKRLIQAIFCVQMQLIGELPALLSDLDVSAAAALHIASAYKAITPAAVHPEEAGG